MADLLKKLTKDPKLIVVGIIVVAVGAYVLWSILAPSTTASPSTGASPAIVPHNISGGKPAVVLFWAGWCGNCTSMKGDWDRAANILIETGRVDVRDFEADRDKNDIDMAQKELDNFRGYPDIRFYPDGYRGPSKPIQFNEARTEENIVSFVYGLMGH